MLDKLKALFHDKPEVRVDAPVDTKKHPAHLIQRDANGKRVYHEIVLADEPDAEGNLQWLARVYSSQPAVERRGAQPSREAAIAAAVAWAMSVRNTLVR